MTIVIVEDDYLQADWIHKKLKEAIPDANLRHISTESEFRSSFEDIANEKADVVVMDVMLRWTDPSPDLHLPPDDIGKEGFYRAGLRCESLLANDQRTSNIPVILYTVLERTDLNHELRNLADNVVYIPKQPDVNPLIDRVKELTRQQPKT